MGQVGIRKLRFENEIRSAGTEPEAINDLA
jgi:hypothetical protein